MCYDSRTKITEIVAILSFWSFFFFFLFSAFRIFFFKKKYKNFFYNRMDLLKQRMQSINAKKILWDIKPQLKILYDLGCNFYGIPLTD